MYIYLCIYKYIYMYIYIYIHVYKFSMFLHLKCRVRHFFKKQLHFGLFKNLLKTVHLTELYLRK